MKNKDVITKKVQPKTQGLILYIDSEKSCYAYVCINRLTPRNRKKYDGSITLLQTVFSFENLSFNTIFGRPTSLIIFVAIIYHLRHYLIKLCIQEEHTTIVAL